MRPLLSLAVGVLVGLSAACSPRGAALGTAAVASATPAPIPPSTAPSLRVPRQLSVAAPIVCLEDFLTLTGSGFERGRWRVAFRQAGTAGEPVEAGVVQVGADGAFHFRYAVLRSTPAEPGPPFERGLTFDVLVRQDGGEGLETASMQVCWGAG